MADARFECGYAKLGTSSCRKCKQKIEKGSLRLAKVVDNPFSSGGGDMKQYHHPKCMFDTFVRARPTTRIITEPDDLRGYDDLLEDDQKIITDLIDEVAEQRGKSSKKSSTPKKAGGAEMGASSKKAQNSKSETSSNQPGKSSKTIASAGGNDDDDAWGDDDDETYSNLDVSFASDTSTNQSPSKQLPTVTAASGKPVCVTSGTDNQEAAEKDDSFREYRKLCAEIAEESSYTGKTRILSRYLQEGSTGSGYHGDTFLLLKLLLPGVIKAVYNLHNKQIVKLFSQIFDTDLDEMTEDLEAGDVAETVALFFDKSKKCPPQKKSTLSLQEVDDLLDDLSQQSKEDDQIRSLTKIAKRCTANDLKMVIRLIKHDLRINAGARHILDALDPNAYDAFMASRDLRDVVDRVKKAKSAKVTSKGELTKNVSVKVQLMTPIQPMLAEACRSIEQAFKKCPNGIYAEIKYDGERVQLHKKGTTFQYFSRSLKPVQAHKVQHLKEFIPKAFVGGSDLILDCEILLVDTKTSKPLPFGTLGVHKRTAFKDASVCLFVFDCIHYNEHTLMDKPISYRKKILQENMKEIKNHVMFSEIKHIKPQDKDSLTDLMTTVFKEGLEGLVLKDVNGTYEPGKRHWLKIKKDYLADGAMADSADLVVLGAYFGTGSKGGMMSVFLMGVYDPNTFRWCTVTKCGNGFDDKMLKKLQTQLNMVKINKDPAKVPAWLNVTKTLVPDFVIADPKKSQVWEISGAEFSKSDVHTASGISIRFPRFTRLRDDKSVQQATDLPHLLKLFASSKERSDIPAMTKKPSAAKKTRDDDEGDDENNDATDEDAMNSDVEEDNKSTAVKPKSEIASGKKKDEDEQPSVKKFKKDEESDLPPCRYGASCYQKNPDHRKKFSHPVSAPTTSSVLANVFTGCQFFISDTVADAEKMKRYIIAFDGDVLNSYEKKFATHIVVAEKTEADKDSSGRSIPADWVWQCIKNKAIVNRS